MHCCCTTAIRRDVFAKRESVSDTSHLTPMAPNQPIKQTYIAVRQQTYCAQRRTHQETTTPINTTSHTNARVIAQAIDIKDSLGRGITLARSP